MNQYRQGDVYLLEVTEVPEGAVPVHVERIILAEGEATGHAHRVIGPGATIYQDDLPEPGFSRYLVVDQEGVRLMHDEHGQIAVAPGVYEVRRQREYASEAVRLVAD